MVVEAVTQAQAATAVMLASVDSGTASVEELREALAQSRSVMANVTAFQTSAAELIAKRERHGDGGAEILASSAGMSQREAHSQVKTAEVLDELSCNARWTGLVFDHCGDAIWRSRSRRTVTDTQWQTLLAIYGGCFHCGAPPGICQAHHITAYSRGGDTSLKNLIMVCWSCHHKIHHHNWRIREHPDGSHTLHPPDQTPRYGPAHAEDPEPENPLHQARARAPARVQSSGARRALVSRSKGRVPARARAPDPNMLW